MTRPMLSLPLGRIPDASLWSRFFPRSVNLPIQQVNHHVHVMGAAGSGKSRFLCNYYLSLVEAGIGTTLLDPHGDLAELILCRLVERNNQDILQSLIYLDFQRAHERGRYLPLNVLRQPGDRTRVAINVKEAFHRAWPSLANGAAPRFDKLVQNGVKALAAANERLPELGWFLMNPAFRARVLEHETDARVLRFWQAWFDRMSGREQREHADSTLSRIDLLAFDEVLRYSLGHEDLALDVRTIMDGGHHVLVNLAGLADETQRLLGSLFTVMYEQAAKARAGTTDRPTHVLMVDEFANFSAQSERALQTMLSEARKFSLFLVMAHQNWSQTSSKLRGAMGNAKIRVAFQLDREDAEVTAKSYAKVVPIMTHTRDGAVGYSKSVADQIEEVVQTLMNLPPRHALVRLPDHSVVTLVTEDVRDRGTDTRSIERAQLERHFQPAGVSRLPERLPDRRPLRIG